MKLAIVFLALFVHSAAAARLRVNHTSCEIEDVKARTWLQNKLANKCEDMCKEVGAYPKCKCPDFVQPDSTPGVMTWDELLEYMDKLVDWSGDTIRAWKTVASQLQKSVRSKSTTESCAQSDKRHRALLQNMVAKKCEEMCKEVGAYPKCTCPDFAQPDSTPGVMTWDELLEYMDKLVDWSGDTIRSWKATAAELQIRSSSNESEKSCEAEDRKARAFLQNKLAKKCEEMCKEVGAYPKCTCPDFAQPDSTPGVMTWDELLEYMDKLVDWSGDTIRGWKKMASQLQQSVRSKSQSCISADKQHRVFLQNALAGKCEEMCKEVGAYPKCNCPDFVQPDSTPGVMTWDELLEYMDKLVDWSGDTIRGWKATAAELQIGTSSNQTEKSCEAEDRKARAFLQNKLAKKCEEMCKEVGAYPKCTCPDFAQPDSTPGVMTWDELLEYMDKLVDWSGDTIRGWKKMASQLQQSVRSKSQSCISADKQRRVFLQNTLAGKCEEMCKEVGAYPKCNCPDFVQPDSTPGVMTWDELLEYMDKLVDWSGDTIRGWKKTASTLQIGFAFGPHRE